MSFDIIDAPEISDSEVRKRLATFSFNGKPLWTDASSPPIISSSYGSWNSGGVRKLHEVFKDSTTIFSLLLVVEGGPNTLKVVYDAVASRTPVVVSYHLNVLFFGGEFFVFWVRAHFKHNFLLHQVIEGSGRIADVLAYAWRFLHDDR